MPSSSHVLSWSFMYTNCAFLATGHNCLRSAVRWISPTWAVLERVVIFEQKHGQKGPCTAPVKYSQRIHWWPADCTPIDSSAQHRLRCHRGKRCRLSPELLMKGSDLSTDTGSCEGAKIPCNANCNTRWVIRNELGAYKRYLPAKVPFFSQ